MLHILYTGGPRFTSEFCSYGVTYIDFRKWEHTEHKYVPMSLTYTNTVVTSESRM